ncbi:MAG: hypothetical protein KKA16_03250 [Alphaproteobacteria bacterium]|nr:hypothetical protein [Alphaproteobacteria bacterium]
MAAMVLGAAGFAAARVVGALAAGFAAGALTVVVFGAALAAGAFATVAVFTAGATFLTAGLAAAAVFVVDFAAGLGLEAAGALGDAVDGDLAMYSPTPRLERSHPMRQATDTNSYSIDSQ